MERYEFQPALDLLQRALELQGALGDRRAQVEILDLVGLAQDNLGNPRGRLQAARKIVEIQRQIGDRRQEAAAQAGLAGAYANAGAVQDAIDAFRDSLTLYRALGDRIGEATSLANLGTLHDELGEPESGIAAFEQALPLWHAIGDRAQEAAVLNNLAATHSTKGDSSKALALYREALSVTNTLDTRFKPTAVLNNMGHELNLLGSYAEAKETLEEALRQALEASNTAYEAPVRMNLGVACAGLGERQAAREHYDRALALARMRGDRQRQAKVLERMTDLASDAGDLDQARQRAEETIAALEAVRRDLRSTRLRSSFIASVRRAYELHVDVLMRLHRLQPGVGYQAQALRAAELARARVLLDSLSEAQAGIKEGVDPALIEQERTLRERLSAAVDRHMRLSTDAGAADRAPAAAAEVQALTSEWDAVKARLKATGPRYAALRDPEPLAAGEIQRQVLDEQTVLLEYALGDKRSFLWVAARETLAAYELPPRADVERAARAVYESVARPGAQDRQALAALSRMILGPAADTLKARRLLIVPDGALHYVPFAALPDPAAPGRPLLAGHEIVTAPSASVLALLRREHESRPRPARAVAVLADPVFERQDARFGGTAAPNAPRAGAQDALLLRALSSANSRGLPRLPFTRREADAILGLVPPGQRRGAFDFEASRQTATDPSLAEFRLVHFATHGFLNSAHPELSGIVLSLLDKTGSPTRGFLTAADVFNLRLNADMVVLSGCQTALGQELRGEGLVGLSRAFMYAGTARVVSSLWRVDDAATAELMKALYRGVIKEGLSPAAALRAAQLGLMRRARFQDPFYWAAFQLQGEWR
jgi:CHAT domain-containing protein/Tfp pilus assembly protein PilF